MAAVLAGPVLSVMIVVLVTQFTRSIGGCAVQIAAKYINHSS